MIFYPCFLDFEVEVLHDGVLLVYLEMVAVKEMEALLLRQLLELAAWFFPEALKLSNCSVTTIDIRLGQSIPLDSGFVNFTDRFIVKNYHGFIPNY